MDRSELDALVGLSLDTKVAWAREKVQAWYEAWNGQVYVSFSGGKDSTALLHLVRELYPDVPAVFCNTGLEWPEVVRFVRGTPNVDIIRPTMTFRQVVEKYGYPVVSKEQSQYIYEIRNHAPEWRDRRLNGDARGRFRLSKRWRFLLDAPFPISEQCCKVMKKHPFKKYERKTGRHPYLGIMAENSRMRFNSWRRYGCNAFELDRPRSWPLAIWHERDVWSYIRENDLAVSDIYAMGYERTGCTFCMFGVIQETRERGTNRFMEMATSHPKLHRYGLDKLGLREVLEFCRVPYHGRRGLLY